ncbi:unnamed protein product [Linum trigynum]|uniref:C2 domain-containing protein n=1 Tax=Linum trigynum TaxID=586398 RepID=A0AAV2ENP8_9ROSI
MAVGILEVHVVSAKGLKSTDFLGGIDPYVVVQYRNQERQTSVARGAGGSPEWNEKLTFRVEYPINGQGGGEHKLLLKIMDHDTFSADDFLGLATIHQVKDLLEIGVEKGSSELHPCKHSVVTAANSYCGEIKVGLTITIKREGGDGGGEGQQFGGWRQSRDF